MSNKGHSRILRQLAAEIIEQIAKRIEVSDTQRQDWQTSLIRQWISYDGEAALFLQGHQFQFTLRYTPLGKPYCNPAPVHADWARTLVRRFNINPDDIPEIFEQLNRGQSADVVNSEGKPLRLSVNPKTQRRNVDALTKEALAGFMRGNHDDAAANALRNRFGSVLADDEVDALAYSLTRQWQKYNGVASLFVQGEEVLFLLEVGSTQRTVREKHRPTNVENELRSLGLEREAIPNILARLNLGQEIPFQDRQGQASILWYDPMAGKVRAKENGQDSMPATITACPIFCPQCGAVLTLPRTTGTPAVCPNCGPA